MKGKKTNQEIHESKRREEEACLEEKQKIEETASGQDVTESRSEYDRLLLLVKKGNTQAFGEFYEKTRGQVMGMPTACCSRPRMRRRWSRKRI